MAVKTLAPQGVTWAISETQASTEGHQQIWDGPIGIFVHISLYIYMLYVYIHIAYRPFAATEGHQKKDKKKWWKRGSFSKETTKIWAQGDH